MIKRIVVMEILPGQEDIFLNIFEEVKQEIRNQPGCTSLEVLQGHHHEHVTLCTISTWTHDGALEDYRSSPLFKSTWSRVKPLFAHKARAWTLTPIETVT